LTAEQPASVAPYVALAGVVLALAFVIAGLVRVVLEWRSLKKRIDEVAELPFLPTLELTAARLDIATRQIDTLPYLEARARQAIADLQAARAQLASAFGVAWAAVRTVVTGT
jgi:hypothetical protein